MPLFQNLVARLSMDYSGFDRNSKAASQSLRGLMADSNRTSQAFLGLAKAGLGLAGVGVSIYGVKQALTSVTREAAGFQMGMAKISTMLDRADMVQLPQFADAIKKMSVAYGEGARTLQQGATDIIGSAIAPAKAMKVLEASTIAAKGGFTETSTVVKAVVGLLNAYGMEAGNATRITDIMHAVVRDGVISFEDLAQNIGTVSSLAAVLDVDLEAVGAAISTMTRAGINAEISITALRAILNAFMNPTDEARAAAAELGFALDETSIKGGGLIEIMDKLRKANAQQLEALMPNVRGLVGFTSMLKNASGMAKDYQTNLHAAGTAQEAFNKVANTAGFEIDRAKQAWSNLKVAMGDIVLPTVTAAMNTFTDAIQNNQSALNRYVSDYKEGLGIIKQIALEGPKNIIGATGLSDDLQLPKDKGAFPTWARRAAIKEYQQATGDVNAFTRVMQETGLEGEQPPKYMAKWHQIQAAYLEQVSQSRKELAAAVQAQETLAGPSPWMTSIQNALMAPGLWLGKGIKQLESLSTVKPTGMMSLFGDLQQETQMLGMTEAQQRELLALQKARAAAVKDYNDHVRQTPQLTEGETRAIKMLIERQEQLAQSRRQAEFGARFEEQLVYLQQEGQLLRLGNNEREAAALLMDAQNEAARMGVALTAEQTARLREQVEALQAQRKAAEVSEIISGGLTDGMRNFTAAIRESGDAMEALRNSALRMMDNLTQRLLWQPMENMLFKGLMGLGTSMAGGSAMPNQSAPIATTAYAHAGGRIGYDALPQRAMPARLFARAPRFHSGLNTDEFPVILQRGETVRTSAQERALKRQSQPMNLELHVHDESGPGVEVVSAGIEQMVDRAVARLYIRDRLRRGPRTRGA